MRWLLKAGPTGPGSRGGQVVGTTPSGAPKYATTHPEDHGRYFHTGHEGTQVVPLEHLHTFKHEPKSIDNAIEHMGAAYRGHGEKRAPVTVWKRPEGGYDVADGNATTGAARKLGWKSLPVRVKDRPPKDHASGSVQECPGCAEFRKKQTSFSFAKARRVSLNRLLNFEFRKAKPPKEPPPSFGPAPEGAGKVELGKTRRGKPVFASGAESGKFSDEDHVDAAKLHALAMAHHDGQAGHHRESGEGDTDWKRSETHAGDAKRHGDLSTHHLDLVRDHLVAAGRGSSSQLDFSGESPALGKAEPMGDDERNEARKRLAGRSHHDHPGGITDADRAAYEGFKLEGDDADGDRGARRPQQ